MKILLGYQKRSYTNKEGRQIEGYEIYFANQIEANGEGYSPSLRFNPTRKQFQNWFISKSQFEKLYNIKSLVGKAVEVYTDPDYGNLASITAVK